MRRPRDGEPTCPWCVGAARFWIQRELGGWLLTVSARCRVGSLESETEALLDTGAEWSIVGGELAQVLAEEADDQHVEITMRTRLGSVPGRLHRLNVTLVADEGEDLHIDSSLLLAPSWRGPPVLGYRGLLERIRFGLEPGNARDDQWIFFGAAR